VYFSSKGASSMSEKAKRKQPVSSSGPRQMSDNTKGKQSKKATKNVKAPRKKRKFSDKEEGDCPSVSSASGEDMTPGQAFVDKSKKRKVIEISDDEDGDDDAGGSPATAAVPGATQHSFLATLQNGNHVSIRYSADHFPKLKLTKAKGDGSCLFHSVAMTTDHQFGNNGKELRLAVADWIEANRIKNPIMHAGVRLQQWYRMDGYKSFAAWIRAIRFSSNFGSLNELYVLAEMLDLQIYIWSVHHLPAGADTVAPQIITGSNYVEHADQLNEIHLVQHFSHSQGGYVEHYDALMKP
jgi:hypothetical protein